MGRYAFTYSEAQRSALIRHALDDGGTAASAARRARAGELYGLDAFTISDDYCRELVRNARKQRKADELRTAIKDTSGAAAYAELERRGLEVVADAIQALGTKPDPAALREWFRTLRAIREAMPPAPGKNGTPGPDPEPPEPNGNGKPEPSALETAAAALAQRPAR